MARGQKPGWKLSQKVPKERPVKAVKVERGVWYRPSGRFMVFLYHRGREVYVGTFGTIQEAVDAREARRHELRMGRPVVRVASGRMLLNEFAEKVYFPETAALRKASTARANLSRFAKHIKPAFEDVPLRDVTYDGLCAFRAKLQTSAKSGQTRREVLLVLKAILEEAKERGLIPANPALGLKLPPKDATQVTVPAYEVAVQVVEGIAHPVGRMLAQLLLYAGPRINEALALRWDDIDLDGKTLFISRSIDQLTGAFVAPKTAAGVRTVELPDELVALLRAYRAGQLANEVMRIDPWVFPAKESHSDERPPILHDRNFVNRYWNPAVKAAGCPRFSPHALRHVYCSLLLMRGAPVTYVSAQAGHANAGFTLKQYARFLRSAKETGRDYLKKAFGTATTTTAATGSSPSTT